MNLILVAAIILAYIIKGMCGFANTLVFSTIMSYSTNTINITPVELIVGYPSNLYIAWKERKGISTKVWLPLSALVILGSIPGAIFLKNGDVSLLKTLFGFTVVFLSLEMLLRERQKTPKKSSGAVLGVIGIVSGVLCGLFGVGAFLVAYISRTTTNKNEFRGNICMVFLIENTFRILLYSFTKILNIEILRQSVLLLPFMAIGLGIGIFLNKKMNEILVKKAVILLLLLSGISLIVNNIK